MEIIVRSGHWKKREFDRLNTVNKYLNKELKGKGVGGVHEFSDWSDKKVNKYETNGSLYEEREQRIKDMRKKEIIK